MDETQLIENAGKTSLLIVEDESAIRNSLAEYMEAMGYITYLAESAEVALELLEKTPVDVVITDIVLTGKDGLELTDIIKQNFDSDVVVMTGYIADFSYEEAINRVR
jgi:two-component system cell cycle response regulator